MCGLDHTVAFCVLILKLFNLCLSSVAEEYWREHSFNGKTQDELDRGQVQLSSRTTRWEKKDGENV